MNLPRVSGSRLAGALLGLALVLLLRRYPGIDHDATLYLGQALALRVPEIFAEDLFFAHGSQGRYTLFPWLLAAAMAWVPPVPLFLWGSLAGLLLFAAAGWLCLRALLPPAQRFWAWLGVLALPTMYGRTVIFSYHEPFLTPRPFAEALCLLAVALLAGGRRLAGLACLGLATLLHPLQAIAAALVLWPWLVLQDRRWLHAGWLALPVLALAAGGVAPFDGLLRPLDAQWLAELRQGNGQLFLTGWPHADYAIVAFDVLLLAAAWRAMEGAWRGWCLAALCGLGLGLGASFVLVDLLALELPAGLQLWRVHWLAHWLAMASLALLLRRDLLARDLPRIACLALAALLAWGGHAWAWLPFGALYLAWPRLAGQLQPRMRTLLGGLFALGVALLLAHHVANELLAFRALQSRLDLYPLDRRLLGFPLIALGLPLLGWWAWRRAATGPHRLLLLGLLGVALAVGAWRWDARVPHRLAVEAVGHRPDLFGVALPPGAQVYWDRNSLVGTWLVLGRADYYDPQQLSGMAFNRATIVDARRRLERLTPLVMESLHCQQAPMPEAVRARCRIGEASLARACAPGPVRPPEYLVLPYPQAQPALGQWQARDVATGEVLVTHWLYRCGDVGPHPSPPPQAGEGANGGP